MCIARVRSQAPARNGSPAASVTTRPAPGAPRPAARSIPADRSAPSTGPAGPRQGRPLVGVDRLPGGQVRICPVLAAGEQGAIDPHRVVVAGHDTTVAKPPGPGPAAARCVLPRWTLPAQRAPM